MWKQYIISCTLILIQFINLVNSQCRAVSCAESSVSYIDPGNGRRNTACVAVNSTSIVYYANKCQEGNDCFINENFYGTCEPSIDNDFGYILYNGYRCRGDTVYGSCAFGTKVCNLDNRCEGAQAFRECGRDTDCNPNYYCSGDGICLPNYSTDSPSTNYYDINTSLLSSCKTIDSTSSGKCSTGLKSTNKGKACSSFLDCPSSEANTYAKCKCGYSSSTSMLCDILPGDDEWVAVTNAYLDYLNNDLFCATPEHYGKYFDKSTYYSIFKCTEAKAKLYVELIGNPTCLVDNYDKTPMFSDINMFCKAEGYILKALLLFALLFFLILE